MSLWRGLGGAIVCLLLTLSWVWPGSAVGRAGTAFQSTARRFEALREDPLRLRMFLAAMPKGGDLHNHLDGAVYAESYLAHAKAAGLCIDAAALAIRTPPCVPPAQVATAALAADPALWNRMVDALSMRDFVATATDRSGHDHFFATFGRFEAAGHDTGAMLAEEATRAAAEHVSYLEIITLPRLDAVIAIGMAAHWRDDDFDGDLAAIRDKLEPLVAAARRDTDGSELRMRRLLGCSAAPTPPACQVLIRYQGFALRTLPPRAVFAQAAFAAMLTRADPRYVGVNIAAPEDDPVALGDYTLHMRMLRFLKSRDPGLHLSLHAGELAPGLVPPEALRFHIRQAVEIAGAARIGHGVSIVFEDHAPDLLREMAVRQVAVEINATSNEQILGVAGRDHPFPVYRASGVPVVLCTDDEGVERIDLTHEYLRASLTWHLGYADLKQLARASLRESFLAGASIPIGDDGVPGTPSADLLAASEKARAQWRLEQQFTAFEHEMADRHPERILKAEP